MTETKDVKSLGTQVLDDITLLAKDLGSLIAGVCERIYASVKTALEKRRSAQSATD